MSNPWFRMYHEFSADPKVQALSEALQRRYVMLLCLKCNGDLENLPLRNASVTLKIISTALRITEDEAEETRKTLLDFGFIDEFWNINGWEKRQYISDLRDPTNKERQKRYRERKRNGNVTEEKRPDTDTDTDTDTDILFGRFWDSGIRKHGKKEASKKFASLLKKQSNPEDFTNRLIKDVQARLQGNQLGFAEMHPKTYLNGERWEDALPEKAPSGKKISIVDEMGIRGAI